MQQTFFSKKENLLKAKTLVCLPTPLYASHSCNKAFRKKWLFPSGGARPLIRRRRQPGFVRTALGRETERGERGRHAKLIETLKRALARIKTRGRLRRRPVYNSDERNAIAPPPLSLPPFSPNWNKRSVGKRGTDCRGGIAHFRGRFTTSLFRVPLERDCPKSSWPNVYSVPNVQ